MCVWGGRGGDLEMFHGNVVLKKTPVKFKEANDEECRTIANRLLDLVGGSLGAKRDDENKVVIWYWVRQVFLQDEAVLTS